MLGAIGLTFTLLVAGACARAGFRYSWARLRELREAMEIVEPEILAPLEYIVRLPGDAQLLPYPTWVLHSDPMTMPEYLPHHASEEYDEAMRGYGYVKSSGEFSPEQLHAARQVAHDVMKRQYAQTTNQGLSSE